MYESYVYIDNQTSIQSHVEMHYIVWVLRLRQAPR